MVKVLVNGGLFEISKVEEIVEKRVPFNGANVRLVQIAISCNLYQSHICPIERQMCDWYRLQEMAIKL